MLETLTLTPTLSPTLPKFDFAVLALAFALAIGLGPPTSLRTRRRNSLEAFYARMLRPGCAADAKLPTEAPSRA